MCYIVFINVWYNELELNCNLAGTRGTRFSTFFEKKVEPKNFPEKKAKIAPICHLIPDWFISKYIFYRVASLFEIFKQKSLQYTCNPIAVRL